MVDMRALAQAGRALRPPLLSLQYLRAIAAVMVVFHHALSPLMERIPALGYLAPTDRGVDIFFVISGFIMMTTARTLSAADFAIRRLIRIVPLYWLATIVFVGANVVTYGWRTSGTALLKSFLFIPSYSLVSPDHIWPVLIPGWTLNFEMFFYAVFALSLLARAVLLVNVVVLTALVAVGFLVDSHSAIVLTYTSPLLLEFLAGILLGAVHARLDLKGLAVLCPLGFVGLLGHDVVRGHSPLATGVFAVLIVVGALGAETWLRRSPWPVLGLLGDASYSVYLFHPSVLWVLGYWFLQRLPLDTIPSALLYVVVTTAVATVLGVVAHGVLEAPITRGLSRVLRRRPAGQEA